MMLHLKTKPCWLYLMSVVHNAIGMLTIIVGQKAWSPNLCSSEKELFTVSCSSSSLSSISVNILRNFHIHLIMPISSSMEYCRPKIKQNNVPATWSLSSLCVSNEYVFECVYRWSRSLWSLRKCWRERWSGQQSPLPCITHANKLFKWKSAPFMKASP